MRGDKKIKETAKALLRMSLDGDTLSAERVSAVLKALEAHPPRNYRKVMREYLNQARKVDARLRLIIQHAGPLPPELVKALETSFSKRYDRSLESSQLEKPELIAGVRVRVESDVYDATIANQLQQLARSAR